MMPFPFALMTWRECIVGFEPTEMVHMQVEKNGVFFNPKGFGINGNGSATGRNYGFLNWKMTEGTRDGRKLRMLHSESYELKTGELRIEDVWVDPATNAIVSQNEQRTTRLGNEQSECVYTEDHVECKRTLPNGKVLVSTMYPADGMAAVQRRFAPLGKDPKEFLMVDGIKGAFRKVKIAYEGRFTGNWGTDKYEGNAYRYTCDNQSYVVMLNAAHEIVKIDFTKDYSLALTSQPKSKRYEEKLPPGAWGDTKPKADPASNPIPVKQGGATGT